MSRYERRRGVKDEKKVKAEYGYDAPRRRSGDRLNEVQRYAMSKYDPIKFTEPKAPSLSEMPRDPYVIEVDGVRQCALCNVQFTSTTCEMTHLQGKRHRMALQGKILNKKGKRVGPTEDFGRCDVCNVDYTSAQQRNTHVQGKRHIRNVQMAQRGITPGTRRQRQQRNMSGSNYGTYQFPGFGNYNYSNNSIREPLEHEKLQKEVEKMYAEYLEIAKTDMDKAKELYKTYQEKYKIYVQKYNDYAAKYKEAQEKRQKEQQARTASNTPSTSNTKTENGDSTTNTTTTTTTTDNTPKQPKTEPNTDTRS